MTSLTAFDDPGHSADDFFVSTEKSLLDQRWLVRNLLAQPWTDCWTHERMAEAVANSLTFGVYQRVTADEGHTPMPPKMVGFARIIGDGCTYSMVCDVVIDEAFRGRGLAKFLVSVVVSHPQVKRTVSVLRTSDDAARHIYSFFGYHPVSAMRRIPTS